MASVHSIVAAGGGTTDVYQLISKRQDPGFTEEVYKETLSAVDLKEWIGVQDFKKLQGQWISQGFQGQTSVHLTPQLDGDGNDLLSFQVGDRQLQAFTYLPDAQQWGGRYTDLRDDGTYQLKHEWDIDESWMLSECDREDPPFDNQWLESTKMKCVKHHQRHPDKKQHLFVAVPFGSVRVSSITQCNPPECKYQQGRKAICVYASLACALHNAGDSDLAKDMFLFAEAWFDSDQRDTMKHGKLSSYLQPIYEDPKLKCLPKVWKPNKANSQQLDFLFSTVVHASGAIPMDKNFIYLVVLECNNGCRCHAVAIHDGWVFDSNNTHAIRSNKDGMDEICHSGGGLRCFYHCLIFSKQPKPMKKNKHIHSKMNKQSIPAQQKKIPGKKHNKKRKYGYMC